jgi:dTMP kinase
MGGRDRRHEERRGKADQERRGARLRADHGRRGVVAGAASGVAKARANVMAAVASIWRSAGTEVLGERILAAGVRSGVDRSISDPDRVFARDAHPDERRSGSATLAAVTRPGTSATRGWFITIEGPEGAGKTTQAARLGRHLEGRGLVVHLTREPGGTWVGEQIRTVLLARTGSSAATDSLTDALLFNAARRQLVSEVIRPALEAGDTIVCARYADSTLAYQGYGAGVPLDRLRELAAVATDELAPDLTILLDLPPEDGLARKAPRDVTRFEAEFDLAFHRRVRDGFLALAGAEPERFAVIDARRPVAEVGAAVAAAVDARLGVDEPERPVVRINR